MKYAVLFCVLVLMLFTTEAQAGCRRPVRTAFRVASAPFRVLWVGHERRVARRANVCHVR